MKIAFATVPEFFAELRKRGPNVEPVVRVHREFELISRTGVQVTAFFDPDENLPPGAHVREFLVAEYLREIAPGNLALVMLRASVGTHTGKEDEAGKNLIAKERNRVLSQLHGEAGVVGADVVEFCRYEDVDLFV